MKREYLRWYSQRLHRDMELLIFGHSGAKVLMFPTRDGRFFEYEELGLVDSMADKVRPVIFSSIVSRGWPKRPFMRPIITRPSAFAAMPPSKIIFSMKCCR